ncbi:MAG TPA: hypothetical protein DCX89_07345 [Saprospirales bacterium]|nr:hypothetical protein [Saprospirales bacterium]HAY71691.1 hypothetical protein [Saprospirales bacterium]HRQ29054.1 DUF4835 family protein [Saprospiraceae bacterium]
MRQIILFFLMILSSSLLAQELKIDVKVNAPKLKLADPRVFQTLERSVSEFLNNTKWTNDEFESHEKIEGSLLITITEEYSPSSFVADIAVQGIRPVFNSNYTTLLFNRLDKDFKLEYEEMQSIEVSKGIYIDDFSSLLSFYVYLLLGMDYDSFSPLGGEQYFQISESVLNAVPQNSVNAAGWSLGGKKENRYWLMENLLNPRYRPYRQSTYEYHRLGLDVMSDDPDRGKAILVSVLKEMDKVNESYPNSIVLRNFLDSKRDEIIEIFKGGSRGQKNTVYNLMARLDPSQMSNYAVIRQ